MRDAAGNQLDTIHTIEIETISGREFSGVSGRIEISDESENIVVVLASIDKGGSTYFTPGKTDQTFQFERVMPGNYLIWCFIDSDKNGKFNFGSVEPFDFSEKFYSYPDTLLLKARWPLGDVIISE